LLLSFFTVTTGHTAFSKQLDCSTQGIIRSVWQDIHAQSVGAGRLGRGSFDGLRPDCGLLGQPVFPSLLARLYRNGVFARVVLRSPRMADQRAADKANYRK